MSDLRKEKKISLVVAVFNEEPIIAKTIETLVQYMTDEFTEAAWEMIIVDDGSTDCTAKVVHESINRYDFITLLRHRRNYGQGRAFRTAFERASGDVIVTLDADLSYEPKYIRQLVNELEKKDADIVIASAFLPDGAVVNIPFCRKILTIFANKFLSLSTTLDISAITCAVRAYRRDILSMLPLNSDGMEMNLEVILKAQMLGLHVTEIPAVLKWTPSTAKESRKKRRSSWNIVKSIFRYLFFGYLFNPNPLFLVPLFVSLSVFGIYTFSLSYVYLSRLRVLLDEEPNRFMPIVSESLRWTFSNYTHAFYFLISSLVVSLLFFVIWFMTKQNKFYFEQMYAMSSSLLEAQRKLEEKYQLTN